MLTAAVPTLKHDFDSEHFKRYTPFPSSAFSLVESTRHCFLVSVDGIRLTAATRYFALRLRAVARYNSETATAAFYLFLFRSYQAMQDK